MEAAILEGTFIPQPMTAMSTIIIMEEVSRIWKKMGNGEVNIVISQEDFQYYWKRAKEKNNTIILRATL